MNCGLAGSIAIASSPPSTVSVSTFCCSLVFNVPLRCALARMRCTASITSCCCARNAFPKFVVQPTFAHNREYGHRLDTRIPGLFCHSVVERLILQVGIALQPLFKLDDLQRVG